jgi:EmrB/QacA subfamily drug resistance transporter
MSSTVNSKLDRDKPNQSSIRNIIFPLLAIILGVFMVLLDSTAVSVIIPKLTKHFNSSLSVIQWAVTGYTLAMSAIIPLSGWMSERFGAKRVFLCCIALFSISSVLCSFAATAEQLVFCRVLQGLGGGMISPIALASAYKITPPEKVGIVMGVMGVPVLIAPGVGPILAGWFADYLTWRWIFLINFPIGILAIALGLWALPKFETKPAASLDILGMLLAPVAFSSIAYGVSAGGISGNPYNGLLWLFLGITVLILFVIVELKHKHPILELRVFFSARFTVGILIKWFFQFTMGAILFLIPVYLQQVKGLSAFEVGKTLVPLAMTCAVFMLVGGGLFDKVGVRPLAVAGLGAIATGAYILSANNINMMTVSMMMIGMGFGLSVMPLHTNVLQASPKNLIDRVNSLATATEQVMTAFAVSGVTSFIAYRTAQYSIEAFTSASATKSAYNDAIIVIAIIALCAAIASFSLGKIKRYDSQDQDIIL